uniref:Uncharacterized protein n=1 Tax=Mycena chlorophos TaxID=658473 RepID=A0ABQ0LIJ9_MYCCL|nr:predicted protein [Mycena chlorophos]
MSAVPFTEPALFTVRRGIAVKISASSPSGAGNYKQKPKPDDELKSSAGSDLEDCRRSEDGGRAASARQFLEALAAGDGADRK